MWTPFKPLIGSWQGSGQGQVGHSRVERTYEFVLNDKFIFVQNKSIYEPQEKNPGGETHEDWGFISYDRAKESYVFRQFYVEGFVNHYVLEKLAEDGQTLSFVTAQIENISPGWKARETYKIPGPDEFIEVFELAPPDQEFELYTENHFRRVSPR
jgi:hypothetical protein